MAAIGRAGGQRSHRNRVARAKTSEAPPPNTGEEQRERSEEARPSEGEEH
jgi:hypothetical protein